MGTDAGEFDVFLLERLASGEDAAFDVLYRRHAPAVFRYAWALATARGQAEELVQETFVTLWTKRKRVTIVDESVLPWLLSVCKNHGRNLVRRTARQRTFPLEGIAEPAAPTTDELTWVREVLAELNPADRWVCELCLVQGYSYREAADLLDVSESAVGKRLQRARAKLRKVVPGHAE